MQADQGEQPKRCDMLVVDDHPIIGEALRLVLKQSDVIGEVGVACSGRAGRERFRTGSYDLVMVDLDLPDMAGTDFIRVLRMIRPDVKVLVYTSKRYEMYACRLNVMNISGFLRKTEQIDKVASIIELVAQGYAVMPGGAATSENPFDVLSNRELSVATLIAKGCSNRTIAQELVISQKTVAVHKMNLQRKLGATNAIGVVKLAQMHDLE